MRTFLVQTAIAFDENLLSKHPEKKGMKGRCYMGDKPIHISPSNSCRCFHAHKFYEEWKVFSLFDVGQERANGFEDFVWLKSATIRAYPQ